VNSEFERIGKEAVSSLCNAFLRNLCGNTAENHNKSHNTRFTCRFLSEELPSLEQECQSLDRDNVFFIFL
jgi:hypothetical protein